MTTFGRVHALTRPSRGRVVLAVSLGALTVLFGVGLMGTAGYLISRAAERPAILSLTVAIVGVRFFGIARPLARYLERLASHDLAFRSLGQVRVRVYERLEPLAPVRAACYRDGDLLSRMVGDVDALQNLYLRGLGPALVALVAGVVSVAVASALLPAAGIVLGAGLLVDAVVVPTVAVLVARRSSQTLASMRGDYSADLVETLSGAPELLAYGQERERLTRLRATDRRLVRIARRAALADGAAEGLRIVITGATVVGVLAVSITAHADSQLGRVLIAALALLALASFEAVVPLGTAARELAATLAAGRRILEVVDQPAVSETGIEPRAFPAREVVVALEGVRVRYPGAQAPVLDGFDLRLRPGGRTALVGPSGSGKTTVVNTLLRFVEPECGRFTLDGHAADEYSEEEVRGLFAVAGQDSYLFSTTIRDNIALAKPDATNDEIGAVVRAARLEGWIASLPHGLETRVGEAGAEVSGGQRQRIVIARALLASSPVLVLDEPTAHLDTATGEQLIADVFDAAGDRCVLLITHRSEGLDRVDEVVALRDRPT